MPLHLLSPYVYFFSWIVLAVFSYIYDTNFIYEPLLLYLTGVSIYYTFESFNRYKLPIYFKTLTVFVSILCIYGVFLVLGGEDVYWRSAGRALRKYLYILWLVPSLLSVFPVYVFTCRGWLDERKMKILFFILFFCSMFAFYGGLEQQKLNAILMKTGQEEFTVTSVYAFLSIIPLVILFKDKSIIQFTLMGVMFAYFILSAKRGVVVLGGSAIVLIALAMVIQGSLTKKVAVTFTTIALMLVVYSFFHHQMENSLYFSLRVEQTLDGYTSNRDVLAKNAVEYFNTKTNFRQFVFGVGAQGSLIVNENFTHNDWLAILLEQGLLGVLLYVLYWGGFVVTWIKSRRCDRDAFVAIGLLILIGFGKTLFSMYYLPVSVEMMRSSGFFTIALGYYLGKAFPQYTLVLSDDLPK